MIHPKYLHFIEIIHLTLKTKPKILKALQGTTISQGVLVKALIEMIGNRRIIGDYHLHIPCEQLNLIVCPYQKQKSSLINSIYACCVCRTKINKKYQGLTNKLIIRWGAN